MLKPITLTALSCLVFLQVNAQSYYIPRDVKKAYEKETRSLDGAPGKNYWQNHGNYNISISMTPPNRTIKGMEQITYYNESPDTLKRILLKMLMNVHRAGTPREIPVSAEYITQGIQVDEIQVNGTKRAWNSARATSTNAGIGLAKPLMPHDSIKLNISWHYDLATGKEGAREGYIDETTYYLAYFYPRVAVYDDYNGWDTLPFVEAKEFYNDFNNYVLNVTVPKNFIVWSTGTLQNPTQVLTPEYAKRLETSMTSDSTIHIATTQDLAGKNITAQNETNTWTWTANNISDMALGVSDHYVWDAASVIVDTKAKRRTAVQAAFLDSAADFHHYVQWARNSLSWFSNNLPGVPYPYPKTTSFQGTADMEYPMMVNDSHQSDLVFAQLVQDHEIAHTYFPFYMGINESRYGFMDEGWATTLELLIGTAEKGKDAADKMYKAFRVEGWIKDPSQSEDLPIITPVNELTNGAGNNEYGKPSLGYLALKDMLGDVAFKKALKNYMSNWHGKHPIPWDFFNSMSFGVRRSLNWFFINWYFTNNYIDLDLDDVAKAGDGYTLGIKNIGGFAVPFDVIATYADGTTETIHQTPIIWEENQKEVSVHLKTAKAVKSIKLDGGIFMDANEKDNVWIAK